jgi:hypothetical protein
MYSCFKLHPNYKLLKINLHPSFSLIIKLLKKEKKKTNNYKLCHLLIDNCLYLYVYGWIFLKKIAWIGFWVIISSDMLFVVPKKKNQVQFKFLTYCIIIFSIIFYYKNLLQCCPFGWSFSTYVSFSLKNIKCHNVNELTFT